MQWKKKNNEYILRSQQLIENGSSVYKIHKHFEWNGLKNDTFIPFILPRSNIYF